MSWLFSAALVAAYSEASSSGGERSAPSNANSTPPPSLLRGKRMGIFQHFQSGGGIFASSTDAHGAALLTWFRADFRAWTFPLPAKAPASPENTPDFGGKWPESLAKYDRATSSWKTLPSSRRAASKSSWATWPAWGMMRDGECWPLNKPSFLVELQQSITIAKESGSSERVPTPIATDAEKCPSDSLSRAVNPTLQKSFRRRPLKVPTSTARDYRSPGLPEKRQARMDARAQPLTEVVGGQLNPDWVEWLMGWPIGWTDLEPLETGRFREWRRWHGGF